MIKYYKKIFNIIKNNFTKSELESSLKRSSDAFTKMLCGYEMDLNTIIESALIPSLANQIIVIENIQAISVCKHHFLPFKIKCFIAYKPSGHIIGFNKISQIVKLYANRLTLQENLTEEIASTIINLLNPLAFGILIIGDHLCMKFDQNALENNNTIVRTIKIYGEFSNEVSFLSSLT